MSAKALKAVNAPKKAKGSSKKSKKGWRKNVDIDTVEEFLEDQRLEERLGGAFAERPDEELFTVDSETSQKDEEKPSQGQGRKWLIKREPKALKCFQHLEVTGGVPDPKKGRNRTKTPEERKNPKLVEKELQMAQNGIVKAKAKMQKQHRELNKLKKAATIQEKSTRRRTKFDFDLWNGDKLTTELRTKVEEDEWLDGNTKIHTLTKTGNLVRKLPEDLHKKPSEVKPVELPHGGLSYNPSLKDHQDLLWKAAVVEMNKEKAERKIEYHTTRMFPTADKAPTKATWLAEMAEGIPALEKKYVKSEGIIEEDLVEEESESEEEEEAKMFKPKTKRQRNVAKALRKEESKKRALMEEKKKAQDFFRIKSMKRELVKQEQLTRMRVSVRQAQKKAKLAFEPAQLGSAKFEEPEIPLKLSEELTGNLRSLKPEGNLLEDRFKSLQKRNVFEPRSTKKLAKSKKRKKVEKRNYKMGFSWEKK